ncbi:hemolysin D [Pandoraea terrae]|uniref:Hemolysin D n=1 Tax=Pandoraea terrae TaxID=1537710 RepID=A0A5E4S4Z7_9BURK|nr:HlyD family efflux transporter periplasmic adaptor subunit [Pandoraea terrae]VVD69119.1 hemolysin D [Pandoraea terrae]
MSQAENTAAQNANQNTNQTAAVAPAPQPSKRKLLLAVLGVSVLAGAAGYSAYYFTYARYHETTDDAYVSANLVQLTPQVAGTVVAVNADDTQIVKAGDPVVALDAADAEVALRNAEAQLGQTVRQVSALYVNNGMFEATIAQRQAEAARAREDLQRRTAAALTGAVSAEDVAHARNAAKTAEAALDAARQQLASNRAMTDKTSIADHPSVQAAAAKVRDALLNYARDTLPAPVTGYVAKRSVQVGQRVAPGTPLLTIVPLDNVWVDANFKEVQIKQMRIGQPVTLTADIYGNSIQYHGKVVGFAAGTGSAMSALPAQNATGNWIKVVQRLPARIELDAAELRAHPLQVGLSMQVDVDTRDTSGQHLGAVPQASNHTAVFQNYGAAADAEIARIIVQNTTGGGNVPAKTQTAAR